MTRFVRTWNPWKELEQVPRHLVEMLPREWPVLPWERAGVPAVNVWQGEDRVVITAELPGYDPDNLDVTVTSGAVTIRAQRSEPELKNGEGWLLHERRAGQVERTIELPFEVDPDSTEAVYENGILTLTLQRPEEQKPRKVAIQVG